MSSNRRDRFVRQVRDIAQDLSGVSMDAVAESASFLELGFDSLFLTQLSAALQKAFEIRITFRQLFSDLPTIAALGRYLDEKLPPEPPMIAAAEKDLPMNSGATSNVVQAPAVPAPTALMPTTRVPAEPIAAAAEFCAQDLTATAGLESVLLRQLALMSAQLKFLQNIPTESVAVSIAAHQNEEHSAARIPVSVSTEKSLIVTQPKQESGAGTAVTTANPGFGPASVSASGLLPLNPKQQRHLDELIANYTRKTAGSKERTQRYRSRLADPRTAAGFNRRWKEMVYPIWVERSQGSKLWDVDGNQYIDMLNGFGPIFLGHAPSFVTEAIREQLGRGFEIGPQTPLVGEVAEMICRLTGMDRASFTCSGSEAVQAAMRLSRTYTGRDKVVVFSRDYHGNFDQVLVHSANRKGELRTLPSAPGIPCPSVDDTYVLEYGTEESLEIIQKHAAEIAAVIVEPVQSRRPEFQPREFLHELRRITRELEIVLVFDEVVTGFRCAPGGAQAYFGIEADLATYGKVLGGGMPIGVVAGRSFLMDIFDGGRWQYGDNSFPETGVTFFAGTFVRHPLAIAAAHATLKHLINEGPALQQRVADRASGFADRVNTLFKKYELEIELPHFTSQMYLRNKEQGELANLLGFHLRYRGVHLVEGFPCYMTDSHSEQDVDDVVRAFTESVEAMVEDGIFGNPSKLKKGNATTPDPSRELCSITRATTGQTIATGGEHSPTDLQKEMWVASQMRPEASAASNGTNVVEIGGDVSVAGVEWAIDQVIARHEALRSTFSEDGTAVIVHSSMAIDLRCYDLSNSSSAEAALKMTQILEEDARQIFDLLNGPLAAFKLIKLAPDKHLLTFTAHMIICDGWGFRVVLEELGNFYTAYVEKHDLSLEQPAQMREYASWQTEEKGSDETRKIEEFWLSNLKGLSGQFELPTKRPRLPVRSYEAARANLRLNKQEYERIKRSARELKSTPFAYLLTAFSTWLFRLSQNNDFVVGVPFAGQAALGFDTMVGQCVHTLPFRFLVENETSFGQLLSYTQKLVLDAQEHWNSNLGALIQKLELTTDPGRIPLAPVIFNLDPALTGVRFDHCSSRITSGPRFYFHYDLGFNVVDEGDTLLIECDYATSLVDEPTIRRWLEAFRSLLEAVMSNSIQPLSCLPLVNEIQPPEGSKPLRTAICEPTARVMSTSSQHYLAPRTPTEDKLARLWCSILNLRKVSVDHSFFELGGQSLAAVSLFARIEKEFGKKLPLATLFKCPTIEKLAEVLHDGATNKSWSPLVPINANGSKPPLFLVHGAGGNILLYRSLGEHLAPEYPLYGLQSKGLDGESEPLHSIAEMADCYVREIKTVQSQGPYYLGGYCLGGTVAYEMAQILRCEGHEVPLVAMLDTYNYSRALKVSFRSFVLQKARFHLANISRLRPSDMVAYLKEKVRLGLGGELANLRTSMPGSAKEDGVSRATSGAEVKVQAVNDYAAEHYDPAPYPGTVTLFKPRVNYKFYPDPNMGWADLAEDLDTVEVAVNPHAMLLEPYVKVLAAELKKRIDPKKSGPLGNLTLVENDLISVSND